ncbi:MAG: hypothetical protein K8H88_21385 [Sandaracinaceae bacterium]|nr:hypothetical protein [Sandaracinaceae bacterium]
MKASKSTGACSLGVILIGIFTGCGGRPSPGGDAGGPGRDGSTVVDADGGTASGGDTATWSVSGARSESAAHDDDVNYVSCTLTPSGLLDMTSAEYAGGDPAITVRIRGYSGPGTFDFTYAPGGEGATADVRLPGGYGYWYFYDYSTVDFTEIPSSCAISVSEPSPGARIHATISCTNLVATSISPDYDDRNAAGFRPYVSLTATFDCDI